MPATARIALSRETRQAARAAAETPPAETARLWADVLGKVPLFAGVPARQVRKIANLGSLARYEAKTPIVTAGDPGEAFYVILSGRAKIQRGRGRAVAEIGPGSYFGEMALIDDSPRSADVVAEGEVLALTIDRSGFAKLLRTEPALSQALLRTLAARLRAVEAAL